MNPAVIKDSTHPNGIAAGESDGATRTYRSIHIPARPSAQATTVFSQDYFGRRIKLAPEATLRDSHLVVEMKEGAKVYGHEKPAAPAPAPEPPRGRPILVGSEADRAAEDRRAAVGA